MAGINLENLKKETQNFLKSVQDIKELENLRVKYLGRKGELNRLFESLKKMSLAEKRKFGPPLQKLKKELEAVFEQRFSEFKNKLQTLPGLDVTIPGKRLAVGHLHPLTLVEKEIREIFKSMNFSVIEGPEVESEYYNFDALNIPKDHPARDMWDTFWLKEPEGRNEKLEMRNKKSHALSLNSHLLLRTHTSPVQIRYMVTHKPPFQIIVPGRVFRYEATDASHETNFHQVEGLMVGKEVNLANFKFVIEEFFRRLFSAKGGSVSGGKKNVAVGLRPSYFPFVEPGLEIDVECVRCNGKGCGLCKESGWLEVMGAGMVHPRVFEAAGYNPRDWQGFAFGLGLERIAMIKYNIPDIRLFYSGDLRFIKQF